MPVDSSVPRECFGDGIRCGPRRCRMMRKNNRLLSLKVLHGWILTLSAAGLIVWASPAWTDCGVTSGSVRILSNDFESLRIVGAAALDCSSATVEVASNQTTQHAEIQVPALKANPARYTVAIVSNNSMTSLLNDDLIRPLDDLVAQYGQQLDAQQLVRIDGKIMAVAFLIDAQHLFYRQDVLAKAGVPIPTSYEEILQAARIIRQRGIMQYPLAATDEPDWDLGQEFVNMYMGYGGELFAPGSAMATIENEKGVRSLEMIKALTSYMKPEFLTYDTELIAPMWAAGDVAMSVLWGSRAESFVGAGGSVSRIAEVTRLAAAPSVGGGKIPATTLWWDGFAIASNISDQDAKASFQTMMHAISPEVANAHPTAAVWLIKDYKPSPEAAGVLLSVRAGAKSYPMLPYMGYLHSAIGSNLIGFIQGRESAQQALKDAVAAYTTAAREAGYLQ